MKWSASLALSGHSAEQTERGIQLKCWKTFRKEDDVIPSSWAGSPPLPPGRRAPQIAAQETAGRMRLIPTPRVLLTVPGRDDALNIRSVFFFSFLTFGPLNIRVRIETEKEKFCGMFQAAALHLRRCSLKWRFRLFVYYFPFEGN